MDVAHWTRVWQGRKPESVTWFQAEPLCSIRLIGAVSTPAAGIIDIGGGASRLVDHLLAGGYDDVTVLDIAELPLIAAQRRLGAAAERVNWVVGDATDVDLGRTFDVWHDRAVFHFLVDEADRARYVATLRRSLTVDGHLVLATFGPDGPEQCSGLPVRRYTVDRMRDALGDSFHLVDHELEEHVSPAGVSQQFLYGLFRFS
jgi:SAM-dependent methyltransferase